MGLISCLITQFSSLFRGNEPSRSEKTASIGLRDAFLASAFSKCTFSRGLAKTPNLVSRLSDRECEVLRLLASGLSNTDIAQTLFLSEGTVKNYVSVILSKLEVNDRTQAAILAIRAGLANP